MLWKRAMMKEQDMLHLFRTYACGTDLWRVVVWALLLLPCWWKKLALWRERVWIDLALQMMTKPNPSSLIAAAIWGENLFRHFVWYRTPKTIQTHAKDSVKTCHKFGLKRSETAKCDVCCPLCDLHKIVPLGLFILSSLPDATCLACDDKI